MSIEFVKLLAISLTAFFNILLGFMVLKRNPKQQINYIFFLVCFLIGIWALCLLLYEFPIVFSSFFWIKATYAVVSLAIVFILRFSFIFPAPVYRRAWAFSIVSNLIYFAFTIWLLFFTNSWIVGVGRTLERGLETTLGQGYLIWSVLIWLEFGWALFNFVSNSSRLKGFQKAQLLYLFCGFGLWGVTVTFLDIILPVFFKETRYFSISPTTSLLFTLAVSYTILKHRFLDIRIALQEIVVYILTSVFAGSIMYAGAVIYYILFSVPIRLEIFPLVLVIGFFMTLIFNRLVNLAKKIAAEYLFLSIYDYQNILRDLSIGFSTIIEIEKLAEVIVDTLSQSLKLDKVAVLTLDYKGEHYQTQKAVGFDGQENISQVQHDFLASYLEQRPQIIVFDELEKLIEETREESEKEFLQKIESRMREIKASLVIPVVNAGKMIGLIVLGNKKLGDPYTVQDINILKFIANQASIAFENAMLYSQLSDLNQSLQIRVDEATEELRQKNIDLEKANQELKSLDKMKDQLIAITSHELKTPASIALNYLWVVLNQKEEKTSLEEKDKTRLKKSFSGIQNLVRLIDNILNVSKIEGGRIELVPQTINPCELVKNAVDELLPKAEEKSLSLSFTEPKESLEIYADPFWLKEVLRNLIANAIKYTDKGKVTVSLKPQKDEIVFAIEDTGRGIAPEHIDRLFQKFWREDTALTASTPQSGGTGLGLYIAKSVIDLMKGKIWVSSELSKGSTFYFSLSSKIPQALDKKETLKKPSESVYYREKYQKNYGQQ